MPPSLSGREQGRAPPRETLGGTGGKKSGNAPGPRAVQRTGWGSQDRRGDAGGGGGDGGDGDGHDDGEGGGGDDEARALQEVGLRLIAATAL